MPKFKVINTHIKFNGALLAPGDILYFTDEELEACPNILKNLDVVKAVEVPKEEPVVEEEKPAPVKKTAKKKKKKR